MYSPQIHTFSRSYLYQLLILFSIVFIITCNNQTRRWYTVTENESEGWISTNWTTGIAGELGTWTVTYKAGIAGISTAGGIRVQLPDTWHAGIRNSAIPLQSINPQRMHLVTSNCSNPEVQLKTVVEEQRDEELIKHPKLGLDNRYERYVFVIRVEVVRGSLKEGDVINVVYGDTSHGGPGMMASIIRTEPEPILSAVDVDGDGIYEPSPDAQKELLARPMIQSLSGPPAELLVNGPTTVVVGQPAKLHLALVDPFANPVMSFDKALNLKSSGARATLPERVSIQPGGDWVGGAWTEVEFTPSEPGLLTIQVDADTFSTQSNPIIVLAEKPQYLLYWGDIHSHSKYSWDGVGDGAFEYARNISGLDFYALTDHSIKPDADSLTRGLWHHAWDEYNALTEKYHRPGEFVTLYAYECSMRQPYGHHNVYFRDQPGALVPFNDTSLEDLWRQLEAGQTLTIPHHTGKFPIGITWTPDDPRFRRNIEIYSGHGLSESFNPDHPLSFENSVFTSDSRSAPASQSAQGAWLAGLNMSTVAASDDHRSRPGQPHYGLTAVFAKELTREAVFDALYERRTYGTTGVRIYLDFRIDETMMGGQVVLNEPPNISIHAIGTDQIAQLELLKFESGSDFEVIKQWSSEKTELTVDFVDSDNHSDAIYYVRLAQKGLIRGLPAMAWSSPIWVSHEK